MKFSETHEWVDVNGPVATIGITDYAQKELGDIVYVELPTVGHKVKAFEEAAVLESTKAAVDIYSPLSGEILEVNTSLRESPEKVNQSPEKEGWIFKIRFINPRELQSLMDEAAYRESIK